MTDNKLTSNLPFRPKNKLALFCLKMRRMGTTTLIIKEIDKTHDIIVISKTDAHAKEFKNGVSISNLPNYKGGKKPFLIENDALVKVAGILNGLTEAAKSIENDTNVIPFPLWDELQKWIMEAEEL